MTICLILFASFCGIQQSLVANPCSYLSTLRLVSGDLGLFALDEKYPGYLSNIRGVGTLVAVDFETASIRDSFNTRLRNNGVLAGACGASTIRLRPSLTFSPEHAIIFIEKFENTMQDEFRLR